MRKILFFTAVFILSACSKDIDLIEIEGLKGEINNVYREYVLVNNWNNDTLTLKRKIERYEADFPLRNPLKGYCMRIYFKDNSGRFTIENPSRLEPPELLDELCVVTKFRVRKSGRLVVRYNYYI